MKLAIVKPILAIIIMQDKQTRDKLLAFTEIIIQIKKNTKKTKANISTINKDLILSWINFIFKLNTSPIFDTFGSIIVFWYISHLILTIEESIKGFVFEP